MKHATCTAPLPCAEPRCQAGDEVHATPLPCNRAHLTQSFVRPGGKRWAVYVGRAKSVVVIMLDRPTCLSAATLARDAVGRTWRRRLHSDLKVSRCSIKVNLRWPGGAARRFPGAHAPQQNSPAASNVRHDVQAKLSLRGTRCVWPDPHKRPRNKAATGLGWTLARPDVLGFILQRHCTKP